MKEKLEISPTLPEIPKSAALKERLLSVISKYAFGPGTDDVYLALTNVNLPVYLAWADIRQKYRRSTLGPFWITISTAVMVGCLGFIFGNLFKSSLNVFLPFLTSGMLIWGFINTTLRDACDTFVSSSAIITQLPLPLFTHVMRMIAKNFYIFLHNIIILPVVFIIVHASVGWAFLLFFPGLALLLVNVVWMSLVAAIICTRFRDMTQIVNSVLQVFFYATPIIWMPALMPQRAALFVVQVNPFYHLLEIVRSPLLNQCPTFTNWIISIVLALFGSCFAITLFNKYRTRIAYWL